MIDGAAEADRDRLSVQIAGDGGAASYERDGVTVVVGCCDPLLGIGLMHALSADPDLRVVGGNLDADALEEAVAADGMQANVVILGEDIDYALLVRLGSHPAGPAVVVVAQEHRLVRSALEAAGVRCFARDMAAGDLVAAVWVLAGCEWASQGDAGSGGAIHGGEAVLTGRESEVLRYLREDPPMKYAEIALRMGLAEATVKTYAARLRRKLGVRSRLDLSTSRFPFA